MQLPDDDSESRTRLGARVAAVFKSVYRYALSLRTRFLGLPLAAKCIIALFVLINVGLISLIIYVTPAGLAQILYDTAQRIKDAPFGWLGIVGFMIVTSFPPLIGYSTTVSVCGFAYGIKGFLIAAPATVLGSAIVFLTLRYVFQSRMRKFASSNAKWKALEDVIRAKGLPLIILIRVSPLPPWVYSNALFASIETVSLWQFVIATICLLPKIFLTVFVGSRIAELADGKHREKMDPLSKVLNGVSIGVGVLLGITAGWVVYRLTQKEFRALEASTIEEEREAAEALVEAEEATPLIRRFSSDTV
ncbi:Golgi apparatus membrane protein TVP38 [Sistotremastrum niveocremeum HHB9708]|uniref:Golgi apparatus membrane protein TVP38 n=2 Tax=Sistotremastraceae TaxID=3402574 RepID=A0A164ZIW4_9AGAM|nr:Golgi apparatus membrane protein TVP38 [Sistotremastrum niveocremeum HHB9708]KZT42878.1 Golgi apparatus membrane protein TVP38 [Sistotremastrum suecicum HHB10207 ss-3]